LPDKLYHIKNPRQQISGEKSELNQEKIRLEELLTDTGDRINKQLEKAEKAFCFAKKAKERFENGEVEDKKEILTALGSNLILKDKKLSITTPKPLFLYWKSGQTG